jgi:hypothetical protein
MIQEKRAMAAKEKTDLLKLRRRRGIRATRGMDWTTNVSLQTCSKWPLGMCRRNMEQGNGSNQGKKAHEMCPKGVKRGSQLKALWKKFG